MKSYLICVDSDGCAMDTMTVKHVRCFGPCMVEEWNLQKWAEPILNRWNEMNLYSMTRGINRFKGLAVALTEIDRQYNSIAGVNEFAKWVSESDLLSEAALQKVVEEYQEQVIWKKALRWSKKVNAGILELADEEKIAFAGVREALQQAKQTADIAIVSSANPEAMREEWGRCGLMEYVDYPMAQDIGTKTVCLQKMLAKGYQPEHVLMIGDAPGDQAAAREAGVRFYPILAGHETESWAHFKHNVLPAFVTGCYTSAFENSEAEKFRKNLAVV